MIIIDCYYSRLELHCYAQMCLMLFGKSRLADMLNSGIDPLTDLGCRMMKPAITYEQGLALKKNEDPVFGNVRTAAKGGMYGFMGMLGPKSFPAYARKAYHLKVTAEETREYKKAWRTAVPESHDYEHWVKQQQTIDGEYLIKHPITGFVRKTPSITAACNFGFQHLGAAAAGEGMFLVSWACYAQPDSPLYGARPVNFVHDQILTECEEERGHEALEEQMRLMALGANKFLKDCPVSVDGKLSTIWSKDAKKVTKDGRVIPWRPEKVA
jgi:hypothetical protein